MVNVVDPIQVRNKVIPADELSWRFSRSSGPGGQSVNTSDSRVELSYDVAASSALGPVLRNARWPRWQTGWSTGYSRSVHPSTGPSCATGRQRPGAWPAC